MKPLHKGFLLALLHIVIVCSLGGKLLYERATRPRVWIKTGAYDPDLFIRGRYVSMRMEIPGEGFSQIYGNVSNRMSMVRFNFAVRQGQLTAIADENGENWGSIRQVGDTYTIWPSEAAVFFLPENVPDPSRRASGEELWIEATIPPKGPPRTIRLGVKKDGVITPLAIN